MTACYQTSSREYVEGEQGGGGGSRGRRGSRDEGVENRNNGEEKEGTTSSSCYVSVAVNVGNQMRQTGKQRKEKGGRTMRVSENLGKREREMSVCKETK